MKPKLVFFQWDHRELPQFLQLHMQLHQRCLSQFFEVLVINTDCDYREVCDKFHPDIALFESGYKTQISRKIKIQNTHCHPQVPKLGLHNGDGWCDCRSGFISDMDSWGIETFFTISTTTAEHTSGLAERFFVWPNFIDSNICKDYRQTKMIPVMFSGCVNPLYPWRKKIHPIIASCYPTFIFPHKGYESYSPVMIHGEEYARIINSSWFVPACGTVAREMVRKHLEIPGSRSCLITERSPVLEAAGFKDMVNCVFADENNVLDKMDFLFANKNKLNEVIGNGHDLVHSNHTMEQRDQIYQWFVLQKELLPHQRIIQKGPFGELKVVDRSLSEQTIHIGGKGKHLECLRQGDLAYKEGNYEAAIERYKECEQMIPWMSEPQLKLTRTYLRNGEAREALTSILKPIQASLGSYGAREPDPVEWAYYLVVLLCNGQLSQALIRKEQFPRLFHPLLREVYEVIDRLHYGKISKVYWGNEKVRQSIHQVELQELSWHGDLEKMLCNCNQLKYIFRIKASHNLEEELSADKKVIKWLRLIHHNLRMKGINVLNRLFETLQIPYRRKGLPSVSIEDYTIRLAKGLKVDRIWRFIQTLIL
jgi:tetratricopeptide (TPR) repeat protein